MLLTEYKLKVIELFREYNYTQINNQHDYLRYFIDNDNILYDIKYYLYCKKTIRNNRNILPQNLFLFMYTNISNLYTKDATLELRNLKINKIFNEKSNRIS